jgi:alpha-glucosidase
MPISCKGLGLVLCFLVSISANSDQRFKIQSPDKEIEVRLSLNKTLTYNVSFEKKVLIEDSRLGVVFQVGGALEHLKLIKKETRSNDSNYTMLFGKTKNIRDNFNEYTFQFGETQGLQRQIGLVFKIYNDGVAFRYVFPEQPAFKDFVIKDEISDFALANNPTIYALPLGFNSSYEAYYRIGKIDAFKWWDNLGLPLLLEFPTGNYIALTEANLTDYSGMYVATSKDNPNTLETRLAPWPKDPSVKVRGTTPFVSPWRVLMIGDSPKTLIESNIVYSLNEPSKINDTSWIKPGKIQFPWWNGYVVPKPDPDQKPGINTWTLKHYIDFCAANGIPYHSIDGFDQAWYGGPVDPFQGIDTTKPIPEIDMPEVLRYAKSKGVATRLWMHWAGLNQNIDKALETYENWGVEGIMIDFLNRDDQEMVRFYNEIIQKTASHHLTVTFHGVFKPTGLGRTYPNLLNHESVLGTEYNKWSETGSTPEHEILIAYIRMLAGPLDTHEGSFRPIAPEYFHSSYIAPRTMGTLTRQLAMYVVYENHLPMLADYPEVYGEHPEAFQFVKQVPVVWDETRFISGEVGKYITLARKKDSDWYIGALTDRKSRNLEIPLGFLEEGLYSAKIYSDTSDFLEHPEKIEVKTLNVRSTDTLSLKMAPAGGVAVHLLKKN